MSMTDKMESDLLAMLLQNVIAAGSVFEDVGSGFAATGTAGSWHVSCHTSDPAETATSQATNECAFSNYARQAVARSTGGWSLSGTNPTVGANVDDVTFPQAGATGVPETITHSGIGTDLSGAGNLCWVAAVSPNIVVNENIQPLFLAGQCQIQAD